MIVSLSRQLLESCSAYDDALNAGQGKAVRYYVNVPGWSHAVDRGAAVDAAPPS